MKLNTIVFLGFLLVVSGPGLAQTCPYDPRCLNNPYGAGSPHKPDGLMNPYSQYGSPYSNKSWANPYATDAPRVYDSQGNYRGRLTSNPYDPESMTHRVQPPTIGPLYVVPSE